MEIVDVFIFLNCALLVAISIWMLYTVFAKSASQKRAPMFTAPVTVFSKAMSNHQLGSGYFIAFSFPDGTRKNIPVTVEEYNTIGEGESGILTYRQDAKYIWFVSFQRTM